MATIQSIRINGTVISSSSPVEVAPEGFVLAWQPGSAFDGYEIRVGSSNQGWGTDSFDGNQATSQALSVPSVEERLRFSSGLTRAAVYFGQIRLLPGGSWATFSIRIKAIPAIMSSQYVISPLPAEVGKISIDTDVSVAFSVHIPSTSVSIEWYCNGERIKSLDGNTNLPSGHLRFGDRWHVRLVPYDDLESGFPFPMSELEIVPLASVSSDVTIGPDSPTPDDILVARYDQSSFSDADDSAVTFGHRWFVNGEQVYPVGDVFSPSRWARLRLKQGDSVSVQVQPNVAGIARQSVTSATVTIGAQKRSFKPIFVDGRSSNQTAISMTPTISWRVYQDSLAPSTAGTTRIRIGKYPEDASVLDVTVPSYENIFQIRDGLLSPGLSYYVTLEDSQSQVKDSAIFSVPGSAWDGNADNSIGWRLSLDLSCIKLDSGTASVLYPYSLDMADDRYVFALDFSPQSVRLRSSSSILWSGSYDFKFIRNVEVAVKNKDVNVYIDSQVVFQGSIDGFETASSARKLQISPRTRASIGYELTIANILFSSVFLSETNYKTEDLGKLPLSSVGAVSASRNGFAVIGREGDSSSDTAILVNPDRGFNTYDCFPIAQDARRVSLISSDSHGNYLIAAHPDGSTIISGCEPISWDMVGSFNSLGDLSASGFDARSTHGQSPFEYSPTNVVIDTSFSKLGIVSSQTGSSSATAVKLDSRLGIILFNFSLTGQVFSGTVVAEFSSAFQSFAIDLRELDCASFVSRLNAINISASTTSVIPFSSYYSATISPGFESVSAAIFNNFSNVSSTPLPIVVDASQIETASSPMGSISGRKAFIETSRGSSPWSQLSLSSDGYTVDFECSVAKIEESLAPDSVDEGGIGLHVFDGSRTHAINLESSSISFDNHIVAPFELNQQLAFRLKKDGDDASLFYRLGVNSDWQGPVVSEGTPAPGVTGSCFDAKISYAANGDMVAVWWSDDGGANSSSWISTFNHLRGWSDPARLLPGYKTKNPNISFNQRQGSFHCTLACTSDTAPFLAEIRIDVNQGGERIYPYSKIANLQSLECISSPAVDSNGTIHVCFSDSASGQTEIYHAYLAEGEGWSSGSVRGLKVTSTEYGANHPCVAISAGQLFVFFVSFYQGGRSKIKLSRYRISQKTWESSATGVTDTAVSSESLSFAALSPHVVVGLNGNMHATWDDYEFVQGSPSRFRCIFYRVFSPSLNSSSPPSIVASNSNRDCTGASLSCPSDRNVVVLAYVRNSNRPGQGVIPPSLAEQMVDVPTIYFALRNDDQVTNNGWSAVVDHRPMIPTTARICSRPCLANLSSTRIHGVYSSIPVSPKERSVREFPDLANTAYMRVGLDFQTSSEKYIALGSVSESADDAYLCRAAEPYIRIGDMSSFRSGRIIISKIKVNVGESCSPRIIQYVGSASSPLPSGYPTDVDIGASGDAFVVTGGRVFHYDWQSAAVYEMTSAASSGITRLPTSGLKSSKFDSDGNMIITTEAGDFIYASVDLFRFVKFTFGAGAPNAVSDVVKSDDGIYVIKDGKVFRILNWRLYISQIPVIHSADPIVIDPSDQIEVASAAGMSLSYIDGFGPVLFGNDGVYRISPSGVSPLGTQSDFTFQKVVAVSAGPDGNIYASTGARIYRLDGSRWSTLRLREVDGSNLAYGQVTAISKIGNRIAISTDLGIFEGSVDGSELVGSIIPNDTIFIASPSQSQPSPSSYRFRVPATQAIARDRIVQAVINGYPVNVGFGISNPDSSGFYTIRFGCPMLPSDVVSVMVRNDMSIQRRFKPNPAESQALGIQNRNLVAIADGAESYFAALMSDAKSVVKISSDTEVPTDEVILDTVAPRGILSFVRPLTANRVRLSIDLPAGGTPENPATYDATSGVSTYEISNFPNFTVNGVEPVEKKPFSTVFDHDLLSLSTISNVVYTEQQGKVSAFVAFRPSGTSSITDFMFTSLPSGCRKKTGDSFSASIALIGSSPTDSIVKSVVSYQGNLYVAITGESSTSPVAIYRSNDGSAWEKLFDLDAQDFSGFLVSAFDNKLYMLTGDPVRLYSFGGIGTPLPVVTYLGESGSSISGYDRFIYACLGSEKKIVRIDIGVVPPLVENMHVDGDVLTGSCSSGTNIYVGTASSGRIIRSPDSDEPFLDSWRSLPSRIGALFATQISGQSYVLAGIDNRLFRYSNGWSRIGSAENAIVGIGANAAGELIFWTTNKLYSVSTGSVVRKVYLRLTDRAGNQSDLALSGSEEDEDGDLLDDDFVLDIPSTALSTITSYGQLIEVDDLGNIVRIIGNGDAPFFSADKIDLEQAIVETDILNASDGHVAWGAMTWQASVPPMSEIFFQVKTGRTRDECAAAEYEAPISSVATSIDLSSRVGQFIQVKILLYSRLKTSNPEIRQLSIESILSSTSQLITTVFLLPSAPKRGIISMDKLTPVSARIIPCLDTLDRTSISDFQEVRENRLFNVDSTQYGKSLRLGFKFLTPTAIPAGQGGGTGGAEYRNVVNWRQENETVAMENLAFRVKFFDDPERTVLRSDVLSTSQPQYFLVDGLPFNPDGIVSIPGGGAVNITMLPYALNLVVDTTYYVSVSMINGLTESPMPTLDKSFVKDTTVSLYDKVVFSFTNSGSVTDFFDFRIRFFEDEALTVLAASYFSYAESTGWEIKVPPSSIFEPWPPGGSPAIPGGQSREISFTPPLGSLEINKKYYLTIESFDGSQFSVAFVGLTFMRISQSGFACGGEQNVPILKGFSFMFELEDGELVKVRAIAP